MRGRKPKPTELKLAEGNPGKRKLNAAEPKPQGLLIEPPEWLTDSQRAGWSYALEHAPKGLLRLTDRAVLAVWVVAEDLHRQAAQEVAKSGLLVPTPNTGVLVQSPYLCIVNKQAQVMLKAAEQLGFSPAARPRIVIVPEAVEEPERDYKGEFNPTGPWHPGCWMPKMN